jgi:hypothetical protein
MTAPTPNEHPWWAFSRWQASDYTDLAAEALLVAAVGQELIDSARAGDLDFWSGEVETAILDQYGSPRARAFRTVRLARTVRRAPRFGWLFWCRTVRGAVPCHCCGSLRTITEYSHGTYGVTACDDCGAC